ncbi:unnamed protein product [Brassica rapa subsp. trilocularis]
MSKQDWAMCPASRSLRLHVYWQVTDICTPRLSPIVQSQGCAVQPVVSHVAVSPNVST